MGSQPTGLLTEASLRVEEADYVGSTEPTVGIIKFVLAGGPFITTRQHFKISAWVRQGEYACRPSLFTLSAPSGALRGERG